MRGETEVRLWLESSKKMGMALGLLNTSKAVDALNLPSQAYTTVHVAGSNGKGTTCALLCTALTNEGVPNLMFSSPHLIRVEERIRINGVPVRSDVFDQALEKVRLATESRGISVTFFEITFLASLIVASEADVDVVVMETGLGGRLDATRVTKADIGVLTSLSLEHTDVLGNDLTVIAKEKAAIARAYCPLIVRMPKEKGIRSTIEETALHAGISELGEASGPANITYVDVPNGASFREEAECLVKEIWNHLECVNDPPVTENCVWAARMQLIESRNPSEPTFLLDGAHNPSGISRAVAELSLNPNIIAGNWVLLVGTSPQTDMEGAMGPLIQLCKDTPPLAIVLSEPQGGRYPAVPVLELRKWFDVLDIATSTHSLPNEAVAFVKQHYDQATLVLSIGSLYLQGNILDGMGWATEENLSFVAKH